MKKISIAFVAALAVAASGCNKNGAETQTSNKSHAVANCGTAIDNGVEVQKAHLAGIDDAMKGKMKAVAMSHCKDDKWSDDVLQCMSEAKVDTDFKACQGKLTPEQKDSMQKSMKDLMAGGMTPAGSDDSAAAMAAEHP